MYNEKKIPTGKFRPENPDKEIPDNFRFLDSANYFMRKKCVIFNETKFP